MGNAHPAGLDPTILKSSKIDMVFPEYSNIGTTGHVGHEKTTLTFAFITRHCGILKTSRMMSEV